MKNSRILLFLVELYSVKMDIIRYYLFPNPNVTPKIKLHEYILRVYLFWDWYNLTDASTHTYTNTYTFIYIYIYPTKMKVTKNVIVLGYKSDELIFWLQNLLSITVIVLEKRIRVQILDKGRGPHVVMAKTFDCIPEVSEFKLQSGYYVHFWTNTLERGMNPLISPAICNILPRITILLQELFWL